MIIGDARRDHYSFLVCTIRSRHILVIAFSFAFIENFSMNSVRLAIFSEDSSPFCLLNKVEQTRFTNVPLHQECLAKAFFGI